MRTTITALALLSAAATWGEELKTLNEAERESNITAARDQARALHRMLDEIERAITALEAREALPGKTGRERTVGKIVNGATTGAYPTAGALIHGMDPTSAGSHCTGTLIGRRTFLSAAHCVDNDPDPAAYHVFLQHGGVVAVSAITVHPDYAFPHADLAVLELRDAVHGIVPTPLNTQAVPLGAQGDIVGYGRAGGSQFDYGIKRVGTIQIAECNPGRPSSLLCWDFDDPVGAAGLDSNTCNADSGGPLYIQRAQNEPLELAGVTSGGSQANCLAGDHSYDVDVQQFADWITAEANGDLDDRSSGDLPAWGTDKVESVRAEVEFTTVLRSRIYRLEVPDGVERLRIAMNGHDSNNRNFDLYVKRGSNVSPTSSDCAGDGTGQYAFCEFARPAAGEWSILLDAKAGGGLAQVSATMFRE